MLKSCAINSQVFVRLRYVGRTILDRPTPHLNWYLPAVGLLAFERNCHIFTISLEVSTCGTPAGGGEPNNLGNGEDCVECRPAPYTHPDFYWKSAIIVPPSPQSLYRGIVNGVLIWRKPVLCAADAHEWLSVRLHTLVHLSDHRERSKATSSAQIGWRRARAEKGSLVIFESI